MAHEIKNTIRISVAELAANEGKWEDLIEAYIEDARQSLKYEVFLNGDVHVAQYRKQKESEK